MLNIAVRAARAGASVILRSLDRIGTLAVTEKARNDFVSDVDRDAEAAIIRTIRQSFPDHAILAEESGAQPGTGGADAGWEWIVDPLDGTTNFLHGFPMFCVSIGVRHRGRMEHGVVYDPLREELFAGTRGGGARLNDRRIRVSARHKLDGALLGTGFPFREQQNLDGYLAALGEMMQRTAGIRRAGSAALDLAYVAAGRLDGFWEYGLKPWDIAAGALLVQEAGGIVCAPDAGTDLAPGDVVAANPRLLREILRVLRAGAGRTAAPPRGGTAHRAR